MLAVRVNHVSTGNANVRQGKRRALLVVPMWKATHRIVANAAATAATASSVHRAPADVLMVIRSAVMGAMSCRVTRTIAALAGMFARRTPCVTTASVVQAAVVGKPYAEEPAQAYSMTRRTAERAAVPAAWANPAVAEFASARLASFPALAIVSIH